MNCVHSTYRLQMIIFAHEKHKSSIKADANMEVVANCDNPATISIENRILTIRGLQVMVDRDLAELYQVDTKVLNQAVKRNIERFPESFRFQLSNNEKMNWSQIVTGSMH